MKCLNLLLIAFLLTACTGIDGDKTRGHLEVLEHPFIIKNDDGKEIELVNSEIELDFAQGLYGLYSPQLKIIRYGKAIGKISIPRNSLNDKDKLSLDAQTIKQDFDLKIFRGKKPLEQWIKTVRHAQCSYEGYCEECTLISDGQGNSSQICTDIYKNNCPGTRWEKRHYQRYIQSLEIAFFAPGSEQETAHFTGLGKNQHTEYQTIEYGECEK